MEQVEFFLMFDTGLGDRDSYNNNGKLVLPNANQWLQLSTTQWNISGKIRWVCGTWPDQVDTWADVVLILQATQCHNYINNLYGCYGCILLNNSMVIISLNYITTIPVPGVLLDTDNDPWFRHKAKAKCFIMHNFDS